MASLTTVIMAESGGAVVTGTSRSGKKFKGVFLTSTAGGGILTVYRGNAATAANTICVLNTFAATSEFEKEFWLGGDNDIIDPDGFYYSLVDGTGTSRAIFFFE